MNQPKQLKLEVPGTGTSVSALLQAGTKNRALAVLGHGAGANMAHSHMQFIADALSRANIASLRFNFPFMEKGGGRTDSIPVCLATFASAIAAGSTSLPDLPCLIGGHSFGGRMSSHYAAQAGADIAGVMYFSFPLHPAGKPAVDRAAHMGGITVPQLFVSGTRDKLAEPTLLHQTVDNLNQATLYEIDTADHGFKILKRSRQSTEDVYSEAGQIVSEWLKGTFGR